MSSYIDNDDLNDRDLIGMIKNCMLQDKVNDQQIIDILKEQIVYLKNEINHKNTVIKSLLSNHTCSYHNNTCSYHNNGEKNGDICNVDNSTYSSGTINDANDCEHPSATHHTNDFVVPDSKINSNINVYERNITFRRQKHKASYKSPEVIKDIDTRSVEIISDSFLNNINAKGISKKGNIKVLNHPGATSEDLKDFINPTIRRKPNMVVLRIGTKDISENIDTISNLHTIVKRILTQYQIYIL